MLKLSEADITTQCVDWMKSQGYRAIRMNRGFLKRPGGGVTFGEPGMADWLFLSKRLYDPGIHRAIWIEFKADGKTAKCRCATKRGRCTACDQITWKLEENARGFTVLTIDSLDKLKGSL